MTVIFEATALSSRFLRNSRRASGSSAANGSSNSKTCGCFATARASATCARCPPDSFPARRLRGTSALASRARARSSSQFGFMARPKCSMSATLNSLYSGQSWARKPIRARNVGLLLGCSPTTRNCPSDAGSNPTSMFSSVVLPAPFAPTTAVIDPVGNDKVHSRSPQSWWP